jgi:hypothetical protein
MDDFRIKKDAPLLAYDSIIAIGLVNAGQSIRFYNDETMVKRNNTFQNPEYYCARRFTVGIDFVSAYAGIHYFAGRKQNASPNKADTVPYLA